MGGNDADAVVREQIAYYRARAAEYDRVYTERGEVLGLLPLIDRLPVSGDLLELACGTGQWTLLPAARTQSETAVDAAPEALAIARERVQSATVPDYGRLLPTFSGSLRG
ncbi:methyltransferase domain-containing protein [Streptomyces sp. NPDC093984]|uniref:methyltransferase domain-containing protein n=1 Tax=Streptomyces sp. NPDC093984 TaxID=3366052 RepID=UPI0037F84D47